MAVNDEGRGIEKGPMSLASMKFYETPAVTQDYWGRRQKLAKPEATIIAALKDELRDRPLLDIGVGTGRTAPFLRAVSTNYIGIDAAEPMVDLARQRYTDATFLAVDAAHMPDFKDGQFAAAFFFGNGIDGLDPADRTRMLREVHRVLGGNGVFAFSARNLDYWRRHFLAGWYGLSFSGPAVTAAIDNARRLGVFAASLYTRVRLRLADPGYAVILHYDDFE